jgi:hypothetical protein
VLQGARAARGSRPEAPAAQTDLNGLEAEPAPRPSRAHALQPEARQDEAVKPVGTQDTYEQLNAVPAGARNTTEEERDRARGQERIATPPFGLAAVENEPTQTRRRAPVAPPVEPEEAFSSEVEPIDTSEAGAALPEGTQPSGELPPVDEPEEETGTAERPRGAGGELEPPVETAASGTDLRPQPRNRALGVVILLLLVVVGAIGIALALKRQGLLPAHRPPPAEPTQELNAAPQAEDAATTDVVVPGAAEEPENDDSDASVEADEPDGGGVVVEAEGAVVVSAAKPPAPAAPAKKKPVPKRKHR